MRNFIILGPAGSGKSTQAKLFADRLDIDHIDMGATLRQVASENSSFGRRLNDVINVRRELVSDEIIGQVLLHALDAFRSNQGVILDGAPRNMHQIDKVEKVFVSKERTIDRVIFINLPEQVSIERITSRFACSRCYKTHIIDNPEDRTNPEKLKCEVCGGALEQRKDDTLEGIRKRLDIFAKETMPVIEHYRKTGLLLQVDGTKSAEEIFQDILQGLNASAQ